jgi:RNA polymerase sigma-70 factor (ECF subfamily)
MTDFLVAFNRLTPVHREVLILVGASGFSYEEAAAMTGVAIGTVKRRASRARLRWTELLVWRLAKTLSARTPRPWRS